MRENLPVAKSGDALSARYVNKLASVSRRVSRSVGGRHLRGIQTGDVIALAAEGPFVQVPLEIVDIPDPNASGSEAEDNRYTYEVRALQFDGTTWSKTTDGVAYELDASLSGQTFSVGDRLNGYWHKRRRMFLPLSGGSSTPPECHTFADYNSSIGLPLEGTDAHIFGADTFPLAQILYALELSTGGDDASASEDEGSNWRWYVPNGRIYQFVVPWSYQSDASFEQYLQGTVSSVGIYSFAAPRGKLYARVRVMAVMPPSMEGTIDMGAMRLEVKGVTNGVESQGNSLDLAKAGGWYIATLKDWQEEINYGNDEPTEDEVAALSHCPYFLPYGNSSQFIEINVPEPISRTDALDATTSETLGLEDDDGDEILDAESSPIMTAEQMASAAVLEREYLPWYAIEAEIAITVQITGTDVDQSDMSSASQVSSASSISTSSSSRSSSSPSSASSVSTSSSSQSASSLSSASSASSPSSASSASSESSSSLSSASSQSSLSSLSSASSVSSSLDTANEVECPCCATGMAPRWMRVTLSGPYETAIGCGACSQGQCDEAIGSFLCSATTDFNETSVCEWVYEFPQWPENANCSGQCPLTLTVTLTCAVGSSNLQINLTFPEVDDVSGPPAGEIIWYRNDLPGEGLINCNFSNEVVPYSTQPGNLACQMPPGDPWDAVVTAVS